MKFLRSALLVLGTLGVLLVPQTAAAYGLFDDACNNGAGGSSATCNARGTQEQVYGTGGILAKVTKLVAEIAGIAAIILVIISGLFFVLASGDPAKAKGARDTLIGALVGVVIVLTAEGILKFVLTRV